MNVQRALAEEVKKAIKGKREWTKKVKEYLENNGYRIIEELEATSSLDVLAMLDPDLYLSVKNNIDEMERNSNMEEAIECINDFVNNNYGNYIFISKYIHDVYNAIFLISKRIRLKTIMSNTNNPFHKYETYDENIYWINFIIKCQTNNELILGSNDNVLSILRSNNCPEFNVKNSYRALKTLKEFYGSLIISE